MELSSIKHKRFNRLDNTLYKMKKRKLNSKNPKYYPVEKDLVKERKELITSIPKGRKTIKFGFNKRPYLRYFLSELKKDFEIILFTAGTKDYAEIIAENLDPNRSIFDYVISR